VFCPNRATTSLPRAYTFADLAEHTLENCCGLCVFLPSSHFSAQDRPSHGVVQQCTKRSLALLVGWKSPLGKVSPTTRTNNRRFSYP